MSIKCPFCDGTGTMSEPYTGALIVAARKKAGFTQEQLAEAIPLSRGQLANIETGRSDMPIKTLAKIAAALGCSMKDLVP